MILRIKGSEYRIVVTRQAASSYLKITVYPDFHITAFAPTWVSDEEIERRICRRIGWVEKQIRFFEEFLPQKAERRYVSGESHRYLGRQYRLKVEQGYVPNAKLSGRYLYVQVPDVAEHETVCNAVQRWYLNRCCAVFNEKLRKNYAHASDVLKIPIPPLSIRKMSKRWGSFTPSGRLILNPELIQVPGDCIEYVIMHELCHGREPNHSKNFDRLLDRLMPDWRERRLRLDKEH